MLRIPYVSSPQNACALACYTMVAKYYFPETTFDQIAKISNWQEGYVVWPYRFWSWLVEKDIKVIDYDLIDIDQWKKEGVKGLKKSLPEKEFEYISKNSKNLEELTLDLNEISKHKNFSYYRQKPTLNLLNEAIKNGNPCEVVLNSHALDKIEGFALHRVVVTDIDDNFVVFHDPREKPRPDRKEQIEHFVYSWLEALDEPELCIYEKIEV